MSETRLRSVGKSVSWRATASLTTVAIVGGLTGAWNLALTVGGVEVLAKLLIFYFHERLWQGVRWGMNGESDNALVGRDPTHVRARTEAPLP